MAKKKSSKKAGKTPKLNFKKRLFRVYRSGWKIKIIALMLMAIAASGVWLFWDLPVSTNITDVSAVSTKLFDRNGKLIYEIYTDQRRSPLELQEIPDHVKNATIAIEDKDFYSHSGFDIMGMLRGLSRQFTRGRAQGGSTLTQQLVKNALLTPERTVRRKLREFVLAALVEVRYSKDTILETYLNQIPYGSTAYGIGSASELYFGKSAKDLDLSEAALLAGLTAAPTRYSPYGAHPELAQERQKQVLRRMVEDGYISQEEADAAAEKKLEFQKQENLKAPHFALWVKDALAQEYGDGVVEQGGLRVTTTLDLDLQEYAQEVVRNEVEDLEDQDVGNGAALVTRPDTGEVLAMVGSKDYFAEDEDGKVNIIFALRQPGSSIKPLNYALGLRDKKITASTPLADIPTCFIVAGQEPYCPRNYDGGFHGATQVRFALGNSYNIPAVRVLALNGIDNFINFAREMGITTFNDPSQYGLSLTLGGGEVRPADMAVAFGVFANEGVKQPLVSILKVEDWEGKVLYELDRGNMDGDRVLDPGVAFIVSQILHDNNARVAAFGVNSFLRVSGHPEVSVKTGTTNDRRDNWTIGYTKHALVVSWVGNNDNSPMSGAVSGVSGASPIWNAIMEEVLDKAEDGSYGSDQEGHAWPRQPDSVIGANVCANSGALPGTELADCPTRHEYFLENTVPTANVTREDIFIDREKQELATEETPQDKIETQNHLVLYDPLGTKICLTCPFPIPSVSVSYPLRGITNITEPQNKPSTN